MPAGATEEQLVGCGADGFHSAGMRTGPTIDRCAWEGLLHDDCIAIHGYLQQVVQVDGNKLVMEKGNSSGFEVGEPVRISDKNGFYGEFTCTAMQALAGDRLELTLDSPSGAPLESIASNPRCNGAGFKILNSTLGNTRSRGILIKSDHGLIEGCTISGCGMSAISIGPEYSWNEADYARHVTVRGNKIIENVRNGSAAGALFIHGDGALGNADITIENNLFDRNYGQTSIHMEDTEGARIMNNRFISSPLPLATGGRKVLRIESSRNIDVQNNTVENLDANDTFLSLGEEVKALTVNGAADPLTPRRRSPF